MPLPDGKVPNFPTDTEIQQIAFTSKLESGQAIVLELPGVPRSWAIEVPTDAATVPAGTSQQLQILTRATNSDSSDAENSELLAQIKQWLEAGSAAANSPSQIMTLQGTQILWNMLRCAILAPADRLASVRAAVIETFYYEGQLREIEQSLGETWPQLEADIPLAFEFEAAALKERKKLKRRFQQTLLLRARLAKIAPQVYCPHVHPPTLASQVCERLRERTRMEHRHEILDEQIEVFEEVYGMCSERVSDFILTRSGNTLEWVIIVLLLFQLLLGAFEMITYVAP